MDCRGSSVLIVAGEASGDLHASKLVSELAAACGEVRVFGVGGDRMREAGVEILHHSDEFAVTGLIEVVAHIPRLRRVMSALVSEARARDAKLAILVDYPGFNLLLARRLKAVGIPVFYYISPQVWAWGERRVRAIARDVDRMAVILPFEERFYRERGVAVDFVGHPLLEEPALAVPGLPKTMQESPPVIGILPGSRPNELERHLPVMLDAAGLIHERVPGARFRLGLAGDAGRAKGLPDDIGSHIEVAPPGSAYDIMRDSTALIVSSGTATIEAACFGTPMVIVYRMQPVSFAVGRRLVRIPDIGLVNVVARERVVPELVQGDATASRIADEVESLLADSARYASLSARLIDVWKTLGEPGASARAAGIAASMLTDGVL